MNKNLHDARRNKNDEFYTQLTDIEKELIHYRKHFKDKTVFCNCDDPRISNFFHYFSYNFELLGLKKLVTTCYKNDQSELFSPNDKEEAIYLEYNGAKKENRIPTPDEIGVKYLKSDGDFRSAECIELLKQADIVCTNPPFSLFSEYVAQLMKYEKQFLIIGNYNAVIYKEIFPLIKENRIWLGVEPWGMTFSTPDGKEKFSRITKWFTNIPNKKRDEEIVLVKKYSDNESIYPNYDNYDAIEVSNIKDIPKDYDGVMGVPITFLVDYNPKQFDIIGAMATTTIDEYNYGCPTINNRKIYARILIKRKM